MIQSVDKEGNLIEARLSITTIELHFIAKCYFY